MNKVEIIITAIIAAIVLDAGLMYLWRRLSKQDGNIPRANFLGSYSPLLTWLRFRQLPPLQINVPKLRVHWSSAGLGLGLALLLAAISQWMLLKSPDKPGWALMVYAVAILIFIWAFRKSPSENSATSFPAILPQEMRRRISIPTVLLAASVTACLITVMGVDRGNTGPETMYW